MAQSINTPDEDDASAAPSPRYRAFIAYSHADEAFARWLHRRLEQWPIPRDLVGRKTPVRTIPRWLRPVFRDRDDFAGSHSLRESTLSALRLSEFLVVICSPASARSPYVNEEIRLFKAMGRADRILPVILAGEPGDPERECFGDALLRDVDESGALGQGVTEPIAADAREQGDGRNRALAKIVAGLLGVAFDEIVRRAERQQRDRNAMIAGAAAGAVLFAAAFAVYALTESYSAGVTIDKSVFAMSQLIEETDGLGDRADLDAKRSSMLRAQCDLVEGLSRGRREVGAVERTICMGEQAAAAIGLGEHDKALGGFDQWLTELRARIAAATSPSRATDTALLKAAEIRLHLTALAVGDTDASRLEAAQAVLLEAAHEVGRRQPDSAYARAAHERATWALIEAAEKRSDWPRSRDLMQRAAAVRALQMGDGEERPRAAAIERGIFLRRQAWLLLQKIHDAPGAFQVAAEAAALFDAEGIPPDGAVNAHYQWALAHEVLGDAAAAGQRHAEARVAYAAALTRIDMLLARPKLTEQQRKDLRKEAAYLTRRLAQLP